MHLGDASVLMQQQLLPVVGAVVVAAVAETAVVTAVAVEFVVAAVEFVVAAVESAVVAAATVPVAELGKLLVQQQQTLQQSIGKG
jgi:Na+-transporting NADH:ubiquinone oxidoreductase subunit NqrD